MYRAVAAELEELRRVKKAFEPFRVKANTTQAYNRQRSQPKGAREIEPRAVGASTPRRRRWAEKDLVVDLA